MSYHYEDPCPGVPLNDIEPIITRARSWLARVANELPHSENIQLGGALFMLSGMEYHYTAVQEHLAQLASNIALSAAWAVRWKQSLDRNEVFNEHHFKPTAIEQEHLIQIAHDAVAYVNRLGQFYSFAKAKDKHRFLVRTSELMIFRHKHTAHRSIDAPRADDTYESKWSQAASMGGFYTTLLGGTPIFQMPDSQGNWQTFNILKDHPVLLAECMATLDAIHSAT